MGMGNPYTYKSLPLKIIEEKIFFSCEGKLPLNSLFPMSKMAGLGGLKPGAQFQPSYLDSGDPIT